MPVILLALLALSGQSPAQGFYTPFSPQETLNVDFIASWGDGDTSNKGHSVVVKDGYIYLALGQQGMVVLDGRNPKDTLIEVHRVDSVLCEGLALRDTLLFAATNHLDIYNISVPDSPVLIGRADILKDGPKSPGVVYLYIAQDVLYMNYVEASWWMLIFDISDPTNPAKIAQWRPSFYSIYQVAFYPPCYLYASSDAGDEYTDILYILDVSDPSNPHAIDSLVTDWGVGKALEVYDHYLYCGEKWVTVWDISDPLNPTFVYGALPLVQSADDYFINPQNKRLYLVDYLYIMDLSDPAYPIKVGAWSGDAYEVWLHSVYYDNGYIYCAGNQRYSGGDDLYILHYLYDTIPEDTGNPYFDWIQTVYGNPGLRFSLKQEAQVSFSLFNTAGQRTYQEDLGLLGPGLYTITLPGGLNPGVYLLFLKTNEKSSNRKIIFTKGGN